jgi:hypothetical protein
MVRSRRTYPWPGFCSDLMKVIDGLSLRTQVAAGLIVAVILYVVARLGPSAGGMLGNVGEALAARHPVPLWLIVTTCLLLLLLIVPTIARAFAKATPGPAAPAGVQTPVAASLADDVEKSVLLRLVEADDDGVTFRALLQATGATKLRLQATLDRLENSEIVEVLESVGDEEATVFLTALGRQHVLGHGLA